MCEIIKTASGGTVIACTRGHRGKMPLCVRCKAPAAYRCDGSADRLVGHWEDEERRGRCSAPLCPQHAYLEEDGTHRCWHHRSSQAKVVKSEKVSFKR
jgi:hypothetical protein